VRLDFLPASLLDAELDHIEWRVLAALQQYVGKPIPQRQLGKRLGMKPHRVGDLLEALEAKGYVQLRKPTEWNPDGSWKEATRLVAIKRHAIVGRKLWLTIPSAVAEVYGNRTASALRLRLHGLQLLEQRKRDERRDPKSLPWIAPRQAAASLGGLDPDNHGDRQRIRRAYVHQRDLGWLTKAPLPKRQRLRLPDGTRRRITGATEKKLSLTRTLIDKVPDPITLAIVAKLAPAGRPLRLDPLIDELRATLREIAASDNYDFEQQPEYDAEARRRSEAEATAALEEIDRKDGFADTGRDSKRSLGDTRRDSKRSLGDTGSAVSPKAESPKNSSLRDRKKQIDGRNVVDEQKRSAAKAAARKSGLVRKDGSGPAKPPARCPSCEVGGGPHVEGCSRIGRNQHRSSRGHTNACGARPQPRFHHKRTRA
jgi:hypothetical protein